MTLSIPDIIFSGNNGEEIYYLPIIPECLPELENAYYSEDFESDNGTLTLLGERKLREVELSGVFPLTEKRNFRPNADKNGWNYVTFFNKYANSKLPIRMIIVDGTKEISNLAYSVVSLTTTLNRIKDIEYTLRLKEYRFLK